MLSSSISHKKIRKVTREGMQKMDDQLAVEEPLEIRLGFDISSQRIHKSIAVTMRTPGSDFELATGFLFTEGIIKSKEDIQSIQYKSSLHQNIIRVELKEGITVEMDKLERNFYTTSSCGVCGKSSIEAVRTNRQLSIPKNDSLIISSDIIYNLPNVLRSHQAIFQNTGGLHACALFDDSGKLIIAKEDVGRHNALDKLIGASLQEALFPLDNYLLLLSGRASFELVQKAWMAGIKIIAAVGAPSSLAVQMAEEFGITLLGFVRDNSFNIYSGEQRILISTYENTY